MLKIGIIGCGQITRVRHAPEYSDNPDCEIRGYFDMDRSRAEAMAKQYGGTVYDTAEELLQSDVDAVSICVANVFHYKYTMMALRAGKHVLCEKPMATTLEECRKMVQTAESQGKLLVIGHNQRYNRSHELVRKLIQEGIIGKLIGFRLTFGHSGPENWTGQKNPWFFHKEQSGFGVFADLGIHKIDLLRYLSSDEVSEVTAVLATVDKKYPDGMPIQVDDNACFILRLRGGAVGTIHVSWTFYSGEDNSSVLYGTDGCIRIYEDPEFSVVIRKANGEEYRLRIDEMITNRQQTSGGHQNTGVIDDFVRSILEGTPSRCDSRDILHSMEVVFAAERAAAEKKSVFL